MDPPLINESSFSMANPSSYSLAGIWPLSDEATISGGFTLRTGNLYKDSSVGSPEEGGCERKRKDSTSLIPSNSNSKRRTTEQMSKTLEPHKDCIHVRARQGQATYSHSLTERITGKALVLDEIINYIQSIQYLVEFLSMKLEEVNSRMMIDATFPTKDQCIHNKDHSQNGCICK